MAPPNSEVQLKSLLLAGGRSSRMGSPKHLLLFPNGEPLLMHMQRQIRSVCPETQELHVSIRDAAEAAHFYAINGISLRILCDGEYAVNKKSIGPAAGLLAAFREDPLANWLIVACDYPLLCSSALLQLREQYEPPLTCFQNEQGFSEPLLGIWSPQALRKLRENVDIGVTGPSAVIKEIGGKLIKPRDATWLINTNTRQEWESAKRLAQEKQCSTADEDVCRMR